MFFDVFVKGALLSKVIFCLSSCSRKEKYFHCLLLSLEDDEDKHMTLQCQKCFENSIYLVGLKAIGIWPSNIFLGNYFEYLYSLDASLNPPKGQFTKIALSLFSDRGHYAFDSNHADGREMSVSCDIHRYNKLPQIRSKCCLFAANIVQQHFHRIQLVTKLSCRYFLSPNF